MSDRLVVRVFGPLAPYASAFHQELRSRGYTHLSAAQQLRLVANISQWLAGEGLGAAELMPERVEAFCVNRRGEGHTHLRTAKALAPLLAFLREQGVLSEPAVPTPVSAEDLLLERYRNYLVHERGLVEHVVSAWMRAAGLFVAEYPGLVGNGAAVAAADVSAFCVRELPRRGVSAAKNLAAALRSFLRFLYLDGRVEAPLAQTVPSVAGRKGASLPRGIPPEALAQLLASCNRRTGVGRRDHAILVLLARMGLRAAEVAGLGLDDIDWRAGELVVHGKGRRDERMPLPGDVGSALAVYLRRGRPRSASRTVFLRAIAPAVGLTPQAISWVVYAACDRAGMRRVSAHQLRHTAATEMLRAGASLPEVGQVLRHRAVGTTAIYAKVDQGALRALALPWPGGAA
jgi:integrase/recombinase XerD